MLIILESGNLIRNFEWPRCWNVGTPGACFYLTISCASTVGYIHSLVGGDVKPLWQEIPAEPNQGQGIVERWKDSEGLRRRSWKVNQEDSSKSDDWKVCMNQEFDPRGVRTRLGIQDDGAEKSRSVWEFVKEESRHYGWTLDAAVRRLDRCSVSNKLYFPSRCESVTSITDSRSVSPQQA